MLKSNPCGYNEAYILVRGGMTIIRHNAARGSFKTCVPFTRWITKIDRIAIDDAEDLDLVM